jgi:hypothetical protein
MNILPDTCHCSPALLLTQVKKTTLTTGKPMFAVLQNLCHSFYLGRTAKSLFSVHFFIQRTTKKKRTQNKTFVVHLKKTHGKDLVCRVFFYSARQSIFPPLRIPNNPNLILLKILCRAHYFRCTENSCVCRAFFL